MTYRWGDYRLDGGGTWLLKAGVYVDTSRRTLACIVHLIEQRHRVVGHAELFRVLWGHESVTHHQLTQVVVAARRTVEDDGQSQRWIRTFPGHGYRWVGEVFVVDESGGIDAGIASALPSPMSTHERMNPIATSETAPSAPDALGVAGAYARMQRRARDRIAPVVCFVLLAIVLGFVLLHQRSSDEAAAVATGQPATATDAVLTRVWASLRRGNYRRVSEQLAALPPRLSDTQEAKLLAILLDIEQGKFKDASMKLAVLRERSASMGDVLWQARALSTLSTLNGAQGSAGVDVLLPAKSAVLLLESSETAVPPSVMGEALLARGYGHMKALDYDQAVRDLERARALLVEGGNMHVAMDAVDTLARVHMRSGRYLQALELFESVAEYGRTSDFPVQEIFARNAATKIDIELLRWKEALASSERSMRLLETVPGSERRTRVMTLRARALIGVGRLREASALIAQVDAIGDERYSAITEATHALAAGELDRALSAALQAQSFTGYGTHDALLLESQEGALLLWLIAGQRRAAKGGDIPLPTSDQRAMLAAPITTVGLIARGRWFWSQGEHGPAEVDLRKAFVDARRHGHLSLMLAATEPLVESLLERGDIASAEAALRQLWAYDRGLFESDYAANLLALRVALASGDRAAARASHRAALRLAAERTLPTDLHPQY